MARRAAFLLALVVLTAAPDLKAATFTATAAGDTVTIYSTSKKPELCKAWVRFTYLENGKRTDGFTSCNSVTTKPGKHVEACHFTNPAIVAPLLNGPVIVECPPKP